MDYITWRVVYTVLVFVLFVGIVVWAYGKGRQSRFDEAAQSIFNEDNNSSQTETKQESNTND